MLYDEILHKNLVKGYLDATTDAELLGLEEDLRLWHAHRRSLVEQLTDDCYDPAWDELERCSNMIKGLVLAIHKKRKDDHVMLSVSQVIHLAGLVTSLALECITDNSKRLEFLEGVRRLQQGHAEQLPQPTEVTYEEVD